MACCAVLQQRAGWAPARASLPPTAATAATARRLPAATWRARFPAVAAQASRPQQPENSGSQAADGSDREAAGDSDRPRRRGPLPIISRDSAEDIAAARQRLQAYLQQCGISQAEAAGLAGKLSAKLGAAADQLVPAPLQWFVGRGMQPVKAAQLLARFCESGGNGQHASVIRQWATWQPVFEGNWQLADSYLAAYQQQCKETKQRALKGSKSMVVMLSSMPSKYHLLRVPDLASRVGLVQQQLGLTAEGVGELIAAGVVLGGTEATLTAAMQWLVSFAGSKAAAASMLRGAPELLGLKTAALNSKAAALQAAWAGMLQPQQVRQLLQQYPGVLLTAESRYAATAEVLRSWFPQPLELLAVLATSPRLLAASAATLQANERWLTGPPLSLKRQEFLARVRAAPQAFAMNIGDAKTQHKLAFVTQVGGVPLERALSASHLNYLKYSTTALAGRYFLLAEHGVPVPRHKDGGVVLGYAAPGLPVLLQRMRPHDSQQRLPADDEAAVEYLDQWLEDWPETDSGRRWADPPSSQV